MTTSDIPLAGANATKHAEHSADAAPDSASPALDYATPWPRRKYMPSPEANRVFWMGVRKLVLAGGVGLAMWGAACLAAGVERYSAPLAVGWGGTFIVLMLPFSLSRQPRFRPTRRRRRRASAHLSDAAQRAASID